MWFEHTELLTTDKHGEVGYVVAAVETEAELALVKVVMAVVMRMAAVVQRRRRRRLWWFWLIGWCWGYGLPWMSGPSSSGYRQSPAVT